MNIKSNESKVYMWIFSYVPLFLRVYNRNNNKKKKNAAITRNEAIGCNIII